MSVRITFVLSDQTIFHRDPSYMKYSNTRLPFLVSLETLDSPLKFEIQFWWFEQSLAAWCEPTGGSEWWKKVKRSSEPSVF